MNQLNNGEYRLLNKLISLDQGSVKRLMVAYLKKHYPKVIERKLYVIAEGTIPICLVAHLDTVFQQNVRLDKLLFYDREQGALWCPEGAGFDDRAGLFAIIKLLQMGVRPHIILCCDEEIGGKGARSLTQAFPHKLPFKCNYFIELDRAGSMDMVFYDCDNKEFVDYIRQFDFIERRGSFTDISILCPHFGIAGVNLSIGYENEHSTSEMLFLRPLFDTIKKVENMLKQKDIPEFKYIPGGWEKMFYFSRGVPKGFKCDHCQEDYFLEEEMFPVLGIDGETKMFCPDCITYNVAWCKKCGKAYEKISLEEPTVGVCDICQEVKDNGGKGNGSEGKGSPED